MAGQDNTKILRRRLYQILEERHSDDLVSVLFDVFIIVLIIANVIAFVAETVDHINARFGAAFELFNIISVIIFTIEYLLRLWVAIEAMPLRHLKPVQARLLFARSPLMIIDLLAVLPFYFSSFFGLDLRVLRVLRLLRFLKLARYSPALDTLGRVVVREARALVGALMVMLTLLLFNSSVIYFLERDIQPENFGSIPAAAWWAVSTLTTVGYGDVVPISDMGKLFGGVMMILGLGMFALPIGIVATGFAQEINRREFIVTWSTVASVPIFCELNAAAIAEIMSLLRSQTYPAGSMIMDKGDQADEMFFIVSGTVEISATGGFFELKAGDYFGEMALLERRSRSADAIAQTKCDLLILEASAFENLLRRNPVLNEKMREAAQTRLEENLRNEQKGQAGV